MDQPKSLYPDYALWILILRAYHAINHMRAKELRKHDLSVAQNGVLDIILSLDNYAKPIDISRRMFREPQTMTTIINILLEKGLIKTAKDPKRKNIVRISLTAKGEKVHEQTLMIESLHQIMSSLTDEKRRCLQECLKEIVENAKKYNDLIQQDTWLTLFDQE